jgi:hypothetical protein
MKDREPDEIREAGRKRYGEVARQNQSCGWAVSNCCGSPAAVPDGSSALGVGYSQQDLEVAPKGADLSSGSPIKRLNICASVPGLLLTSKVPRQDGDSFALACADDSPPD